VFQNVLNCKKLNHECHQHFSDVQDFLLIRLDSIFRVCLDEHVYTTVADMI